MHHVVPVWQLNLFYLSQWLFHLATATDMWSIYDSFVSCIICVDKNKKQAAVILTNHVDQFLQKHNLAIFVL